MGNDEVVTAGRMGLAGRSTIVNLDEAPPQEEREFIQGPLLLARIRSSLVNDLFRRTGGRSDEAWPFGQVLP